MTETVAVIVAKEDEMKQLGFTTETKHSHGGGHNLTSLVDCFAIILIYLLMATSFGELDLDIPEGMKLPKASEATALKNPLIIQVREQSYLLNNRVLSLPQLTEALKQAADSTKASDSNSKALVIQADKNLSYAELNPVVMAGLQAGFDELQFAVMKEENL
jgi:biopolymer transport protein ExbD